MYVRECPEPVTNRSHSNFEEMVIIIEDTICLSHGKILVHIYHVSTRTILTPTKEWLPKWQHPMSNYG